VEEGSAKVHIIRQVDGVKPEKRSIVPYSENDIRALLSVISKTRAYTRPGKRESDHSIPTADRNRAIILLLLDTGIRASELCELRIHQVDVRNKRITVFGKGSKERTIPFSARTRQTLWKYMARRPEAPADGFLFPTMFEGLLDRHDLRRSLARMGQRAGVKDVNVHRFRHTFACGQIPSTNWQNVPVQICEVILRRFIHSFFLSPIMKKVKLWRDCSGLIKRSVCGGRDVRFSTAGQEGHQNWSVD
jgi:integrase